MTCPVTAVRRLVRSTASVDPVIRGEWRASAGVKAGLEGRANGARIAWELS